MSRPGPALVSIGLVGLVTACTSPSPLAPEAGAPPMLELRGVDHAVSTLRTDGRVIIDAANTSRSPRSFTVIGVSLEADGQEVAAPIVGMHVGRARNDDIEPAAARSVDPQRAITVPPGRTRRILVEVDPPEGAPRGDYAQRVDVRLDDGETRRIDARVRFVARDPIRGGR